MKKILAILLAGLMIASCELPDNYYSYTNATDYLTVYSGKLYNDYGTELTVTQDNTDKAWNAEGNRFYASFDILNANYDIFLKAYYLATIKSIAGPLPGEALESVPVQVLDCNVSGGYLNIIITYYTAKDSETPHSVNVYYSDNGSELTLSLIHSGGGESPVGLTNLDSMNAVTEVLCFPLEGLAPSGETRFLILDVDVLSKDTDGKYTSEHFSSQLYNVSVRF